ncbi:Aldehyde dehydrogenase [Pleurostoma richardsiae]|uniref:Aldehyde dehydrogenase n=1 Tax=Pleurostoma richardsiae TaxID=41990 RepID=A0AA38VJ48_9PEZI|nr:Aldehyde dehydrogenase [Pleurostoma richardsiae]
MSDSTTIFPKLQDTLADGRLANVFFRRDQLRQLRDTLLKHKDALLDGIIQDSDYAPTEAFVELYLTLSAIKSYHDELKPEEQLDEEYRVAKGRDAPDAREGVGIALITPQKHSFVYSVIVPLAAAIAAGNCVAVVFEQTLLTLPSILSNILRESLGQDIYESTQTRPRNVSPNCIQVIQTGDVALQTPKTLLSSPCSLVVAIVDRTADLEEAAKTLVDARMQFRGRSPYAPDIILVNEFAKTDFLNAAARHSIRYMTEEKGSLAENHEWLNSSDAKLNGSVTTQSGIRTITSGANSSIVDIRDRALLPELGKVTQRSIRVHGVSSLDDAIEIANDLSPETLLAVYSFGDLQTCNYLLQFTPSSAGFANWIPTELLVGPAAPEGHPLTLSTRYPSSLFTAPRPRFAKSTTAFEHLWRITDGGQTAPVAEIDLLEKIEVERRLPVKHVMGYFEGAVLVGLATSMTPVVVGLSALAYRGLQKAVYVLTK